MGVLRDPIFKTFANRLFESQLEAGQYFGFVCAKRAWLIYLIFQCYVLSFVVCSWATSLEIRLAKSMLLVSSYNKNNHKAVCRLKAYKS